MNIIISSLIYTSFLFVAFAAPAHGANGKMCSDIFHGKDLSDISQAPTEAELSVQLNRLLKSLQSDQLDYLTEGFAELDFSYWNRGIERLDQRIRSKDIATFAPFKKNSEGKYASDELAIYQNDVYFKGYYVRKHARRFVI